MNLYEKELHEVIENLKTEIRILTESKTNINHFEQLINALNFNQIKCEEMIVIHQFRNAVAMFIKLQQAIEQDIIQTLHITAAFMNININDAQLNTDIDNVNYGLTLPISNGDRICVSLHDLKKDYSPLDVERILNEAKTTMPNPLFFGIDHAAPDADHTAEITVETGDVAA